MFEERTWLGRWVDGTMTQLQKRGLGRFRLSPEELFAAARKTSRLDDFGDSAFRAPFALLAKSLETEAALDYAGQRLVRAKLIEALRRRLYLERDFALHPEMAAIPLPRPFIVLGMPRSGTTLLQTLLALDPENRALSNWELVDPWPERKEGWAAERDPRQIRQVEIDRLRIEAVPHIHALHAFDAPPECIELFTPTFVTVHFTYGYRVPSYRDFLVSLTPQDWLGPYRYYRRALQRLTWWRGGNWVLKSPHHLRYLGALVEVFPDVCGIHLHRDPRKTTASGASLALASRPAPPSAVELQAMGRRVFENLVDMVEQGFAARRQLRRERFFDLQYVDLVRDPIGSLRRVYAYFDRPFTAAFAAALEHYLDQPRQRNRARHSCTLEQFGLDPAEVDVAFQPYCRHFGVTPETSAERASREASPVPALA
jgi:hypothetical protein